MSIEDVFNEASNDTYAGNLNGDGYEARVLYGVKISRDNESGHIDLFDTSCGHDYYERLSQYFINFFLEKGWRYGCYVVYLSNKRRNLDDLERKIKTEVNGLNRASEMNRLKKRRDKIISKYNEILTLKNQIK